jgi:hypothetical protein
MKTGQVMSVLLMGRAVNVTHKTMMVDLQDIFVVGNLIRLEQGRTAATLANYLGTDLTKRYISAAAKLWDIAEDKMVVISGRGRYATTKVHLSVAIHAAQYLDENFHAAVIKAFITDRLLQWRDESGDNFIALNEHIDNYMGGREGKTNNHGVYINAAKKLKLKILGDDGKEMSWNGATAEQLRLRTLLEQKLCTALEIGVVNSMDDLYRFIDKL